MTLFHVVWECGPRSVIQFGSSGVVSRVAPSVFPLYLRQCLTGNSPRRFDCHHLAHSRHSARGHSQSSGMSMITQRLIKKKLENLIFFFRLSRTGVSLGPAPINSVLRLIDDVSSVFFSFFSCRDVVSRCYRCFDQLKFLHRSGLWRQ